MNVYRLPVYIVLEIPSPVREAIQSIRDFLATPTARLPVEITVAGSSGIGPIPPGANKHEAEARLTSVLERLEPFRAHFQEIRRFANTDIFYLAPNDRQPFDRIHEALKGSRIPLAPSPWPYNPHCTLRGGPLADQTSADNILKLSFPREEFVIDTLSLYELDPGNQTCRVLFQAKL